ncbi:MAG: response regulator [Chthoniobacteraceae bacterium]|jgi:CheY-like chemotaxis protein
MAPSPGKILVVDDEADIAPTVRLAVGRGYQVDAVATGREAFETLRENAAGFGIVIVDHLMPGWSGSELIQKLKDAEFRGRCIVITGYLSPAVEASYRELGVQHVIAKPFDGAEIRKAVAASARAIEEQGH